MGTGGRERWAWAWTVHFREFFDTPLHQTPRWWRQNAPFKPFNFARIFSIGPWTTWRSASLCLIETRWQPCQLFSFVIAGAELPHAWDRRRPGIVGVQVDEC